jgi:hypothetical protein
MTSKNEDLAALEQALTQIVQKLAAHEILIRDLTSFVYEKLGLTRDEIARRHDRIRFGADNPDPPMSRDDPLIVGVAGHIHQFLDELETPIRKDPRV